MLDMVMYGNDHSICMVTFFSYFELRISQGTCFGLFLDVFGLFQVGSYL